MMISFLIVISLSALSHPIDMGLLEIKANENTIQFDLEMVPDVLSKVSGLDARQLMDSPDALLLSTLASQDLMPSTGRCDWGTPAIKQNGTKVRISVAATCTEKVKSWKFNLSFLSRAPSNYELLVKFGGQETVATAKSSWIESSETKTHGWLEFIGMGIKHIGAAPSEWKGENGLHFPDGIDHILFVVALVLCGGGFFQIVKTVTGFTLGHSITLALATLNIFTLPSRIVESAIALSIAIVAGESLFLKSSKSRWKIAIAFGLIHGMGFATALSELHLDRASVLKALIGFNVGVEIGQTILVCIILPPLYWMEKQPALKRVAVPALASCIFVVGSYWFIQRAFAL